MTPFQTALFSSGIDETPVDPLAQVLYGNRSPASQKPLAKKKSMPLAPVAAPQPQAALSPEAQQMQDLAGSVQAANPSHNPLSAEQQQLINQNAENSHKLVEPSLMSMTPERDAQLKALSDFAQTQQSYMDDAKKGINQQEQALQDFRDKPQEMNYAPLLKFGDILTGGKYQLSNGYKYDGLSPDEKQAVILKMENEIQQNKAGLGKADAATLLGYIKNFTNNAGQTNTTVDKIQSSQTSKVGQKPQAATGSGANPMNGWEKIANKEIGDLQKKKEMADSQLSIFKSALDRGDTAGALQALSPVARAIGDVGRISEAEVKRLAANNLGMDLDRAQIYAGLNPKMDALTKDRFSKLYNAIVQAHEQSYGNSIANIQNRLKPIPGYSGSAIPGMIQGAVPSALGVNAPSAAPQSALDILKKYKK